MLKLCRQLGGGGDYLSLFCSILPSCKNIKKYCKISLDSRPPPPSCSGRSHRWHIEASTSSKGRNRFLSVL